MDAEVGGTTGSNLVHSTDPCLVARRFLEEKCGGDVSLAVKSLTEPPCSYLTARQLADRFASCWNISEAEFIRIYRRAHH